VSRSNATEVPTSTVFDLGRSGRVFASCAAAGRGALVGFLHVGYPDVETSLAALRALCRDGDSPGVDLVEVGLPYSDPMMDGVTIQRAGTRALQRGVRTRDVFRAVEAVAETGTAAVVMTYWNLVERYGADAFARDLAAAGGAGLITPDLTPDEAGEWLAVSDRYDLDRIFLVSPSSTDERLRRTVAACRGWVYATSVMGVTGARAQTSSAAPTLVQRVRAIHPTAAVAVGLGVSDGRQAQEVTQYADAVIVGSALVRALLDAEDGGRPDDLSGLRAVVADLVAGVHAGRSGAGTNPSQQGLGAT
jgi:tryptophan synthase alpha chain